MMGAVWSYIEGSKNMKCKTHPEAVPFVERGNYEGKPIVGVWSDRDEERGLVTILTVRHGNASASVVFDGHGDDPDWIDPDEDGLS